MKMDHIQWHLGSLICDSKFIVKLSFSLINFSWAIIIINVCNTNPSKLCCFVEFAPILARKILWLIVSWAYSTVRKYSNDSIIFSNFIIDLVTLLTLQIVTQFWYTSCQDCAINEIESWFLTKLIWLIWSICGFMLRWFKFSTGTVIWIINLTKCEMFLFWFVNKFK